MKCPKCGEEIREGLKRCEDCGTPVPLIEESKKPEAKPQPQAVQQNPAAQVKAAASATVEYSQEVVTKGIARWHTVFLLIFGIGCLVGSLFLAGGMKLFNNPTDTAKKVVAFYNAGDAAGIVNLVGNNYEPICQHADRVTGNGGGMFDGLFSKPKPKVTCDKTQATKSMQTILDAVKGATYSFEPGRGTDTAYNFNISVTFKDQKQKMPRRLSKVDGSWIYEYK